VSELYRPSDLRLSDGGWRGVAWSARRIPKHKKLINTIAELLSRNTWIHFPHSQSMSLRTIPSRKRIYLLTVKPHIYWLYVRSILGDKEDVASGYLVALSTRCGAQSLSYLWAMRRRFFTVDFHFCIIFTYTTRHQRAPLALLCSFAFIMRCNSHYWPFSLHIQGTSISCLMTVSSLENLTFLLWWIK
jgi:hypothetical protein